MLRDTVFVKDLTATAIIGKDAWSRPSPQPITISVSLDTDFHEASLTDNLKFSLNYAVISRNIMEYLRANEHKNFQSLGNVGECISEIVLDQKHGGGQIAEVTVKSTKSEIRAESVEYKMMRSILGDCQRADEIKVRNLKLLTIIGVFTFERAKRQIVDIDLEMKLPKNSNILVHKVVEDVSMYVESSNFKTVEALVMSIGQRIFQDHDRDVDSVTVRVTKPNAISYTDGVGVTSEMTKDLFIDAQPLQKGEKSNDSFNLPTTDEDSNFSDVSDHTAFIAFGSNHGDQLQTINKAIDLLSNYKINVVATSSLYISKPMYYKDQSDFFNGVIKVSFSNKTPQELLAVLKEIEYKHCGRQKDFDNGPRSIDLDILLYDNVSMNTPELKIPHIAMLERTFVLQPLCELLPPEFIHPVSAEPIHNHLKQLLEVLPDESLQESSHLKEYIPIPRLGVQNNPLVLDQLHGKHATLIMGIMNITPDSFSDGGKLYDYDEDSLSKSALKLIDQGANILDIGGVSTRPGSKEPEEEEELRRVVRAVRALRQSKIPSVANALISVDTYRANVAEKCLQEGADIINDISMGLYDDQMFKVIAKYGCPYIMNHTRGTPKTMSKMTSYPSNTNDDIIELIVDPLQGHIENKLPPDVGNLINGISREVALQIFKAFDAGIRKWQIILDPGIGFAKDIQQNLLILQNASLFKKYSMSIRERDSISYISFNGLPLLIGTSRKKFLGTICNEPIPEKRVVSTIATLIACVQQNVDIVRVHDVKDAKIALLTGDAIYRHIY